MQSAIDFDRLWDHVLVGSHGATSPIHGPDHWRRVERNGLLIAERSGADITVVRLFALFHDSRRWNDGTDPEHGARGAAFASELRGVLFVLPDELFDLLHFACTWHTFSPHHANPTIGTCWDADRLDLGRVGITPDPEFMSTDYGRELARESGRYDQP